MSSAAIPPKEYATADAIDAPSAPCEGINRRSSEIMNPNETVTAADSSKGRP